MKYLFISILAISCICKKASFGQIKADENKEYELYLTQIAAAEAFLQLNKISTANSYLNACDKKFRNIEWNFLNAALDHSNRTISKQEGASFTNIKISPTGKIVAASGTDSIVTLYTYPDFRILRQLKGHNHSVNTIAFSHDGNKLASGGRDHAVIIWDVATGEQLVKNDKSFTQGIYQLCFSPDDTKVGVVSWERIKDRKPAIWGFVKVLSADAGIETTRIELDNHPAASIAFTPNGENVILSTWGEVAYSYNLNTALLNWKFDLSDYSEYNAFHCMDISPDGKTVALGGTDHRIYFLDSKDGKLLHKIEPWVGHSKIIKALSFSPDGPFLASAGEDQTILIWNTTDFTKKRVLTGHVNTVNGLAWSKDNTALFSTSLDETLKAWDVTMPFETAYEICDFGPWQTPVTTDNKSFAAPCSDKKLRLYNASNGTIVTDLGIQAGLCGVFSNDSKTLITASFDGVVKAWDIPSAKEVQSFTGHTARVDGVAYLNKAGLVLSVGDSTLRVWNLKTGKEIKTIRFNNTPFRINIHPNESMVYIGFYNGEVRALETQNWQQNNAVKCAAEIQEMTVSPDGNSLAIFCGKNIEIWNTKTWKRTFLLKGHGKSGYGIGFSADSKYLISGSYDHTFKLWNLATGFCTLTYNRHNNEIYSAKFLNTNEILLSSAEGKVWYYRF